MSTHRSVSRKSSRSHKPALSELEKRLDSSTNAIDHFIHKIDSERSSDIKVIKEMAHNLRSLQNSYTDIYKQLRQHLHANGATAEMNELDKSRDVMKTSVKHALDDLKNKCEKDGSSDISDWSSATFYASQASEERRIQSMIKFKTAQVAADFSKREAQIKVAAEEKLAEQRRQSLLSELELNQLQHEKEVAIANAELDVLSGNENETSLPNLPQDNRIDAFMSMQQPVPIIPQEYIRTACISHSEEKPEIQLHTTTVGREETKKQTTESIKKCNPTIKVGDENTNESNFARYIDPATNFLARRELMQKSPNPFRGEYFRFWTWLHGLENKMLGLNLSALDVITIFEANTEGPALKVVNTFSPGAGLNPQNTLSTIISELKRRFGKSTYIADSLIKQFNDFPAINKYKTSSLLQDLSDLCQIAMIHQMSLSELKFLDTAEGQRVIRNKLPERIVDQWRKYGSKYEMVNGTYPPFNVFCKFLAEQAAVINNPCFDTTTTLKGEGLKNYASNPKVMKSSTSPEETCVFHNKIGHSLSKCKAFSNLSFPEKKTIIKDNNLCFKCLDNHFAKNCTASIKCNICNSHFHCSILHNDSKRRENPSSTEEASRKTMCAQVCHDSSLSLSCSKTFLCKISHKERPGLSMKAYVILDDQSTSSFVDPEVCEFFQVDGPTIDYSLQTLEGLSANKRGKLIHGFRIKGIREQKYLDLPELIECNEIPDARLEAATPRIARSHDHLKKYAHFFNDSNSEVQTLVLVGRDAANLHRTKSFGERAPYAIQTPIGWAIIGSVCLNSSKSMISKRSFRSSISYQEFPNPDSVFVCKPDDELIGLSVEDTNFLKIMEENLQINDKGNLQFPLPFKMVDPIMPNNYHAVKRRMQNTLLRLKRDQSTLNESVLFMNKIIKAGHVEQVPTGHTPVNGKAWWIPVFPVRHPKKKKVRMVFDSSARYAGTSLNNNLLQGPDQNNRLVGVLTRFRENRVGFVADVETMFHCFHLYPEHKDFLRFFWFEANDPSRPLVEYRATVHIFGNRPSPAIAIYGLRHAVKNEEVDSITKSYVNDCFYMDDGLGSTTTVGEAIHVLTSARKALGKFNIHLHKIVSSHQEVTEAFPESERAEGLHPLQLQDSGTQRTLGVIWDIKNDVFLIEVSKHDRPFTRRGILSVINSVFDPLGFVSPVILLGRLIQRMILPKPKITDENKIDWDTPLSDDYLTQWKNWISSLDYLKVLKIPRSLTPKHLSEVQNVSLHVFCDASKDAIGYVAYLRFEDINKRIHVSFLRAGSKVSPHLANTIPRLELNAAVYAIISTQEILEELRLQIDSKIFYTDSNIILGYLRNHERRFSRYVENRIFTILRSSSIENWKFVPTNVNPADLATRPCDATKLISSSWLSGPTFLWSSTIKESTCLEPKNLPETDSQNIRAYTSKAKHVGMFYELIRNSSRLSRVINVVKRIITFLDAKLCNIRTNRKPLEPPEIKKRAMLLIIKDAQTSSFSEVFHVFNRKGNLNSKHSLNPLCPYLDDGLLRVGGRLNETDEPYDLQHPLIIPEKHKIAELIIRHYHELCHHQGRHITLGTIRSAGYFIIRARSKVIKYIKECVVCKKLRGAYASQKMSDLPSERVTPSPPFSYTGMDVFGPFNIFYGKTTRKTAGTRKIWGLLFTCFTSRAIHIEPLDSLDISTFKNAFRRFLSRRGPCKMIRCDQGTNFVGARNQDCDWKEIQNFVEQNDLIWKLNPPHASHYGGVWERKISSVRRIMEAVLLERGKPTLSRDEISTLWCECESIVNSTPLWDVSTDDTMQPLAPSMLLTLKENSNYENLEYTMDDLKSYGPLRWKRVQYLADVFWKKWRYGYLQTLQERRKWTHTKRPICVGDLVLLKEKSCKRYLWPMGKVIAVERRNDNEIRSATIKVSSNGKLYIYERPIHELVPLLQNF